jgi:hypothetical protein
MSIVPPAANGFSVTAPDACDCGDDWVAVWFGGEYDPPHAPASTIAIPEAELTARHHGPVLSFFMRPSVIHREQLACVAPAAATFRLKAEVILTQHRQFGLLFSAQVWLPASAGRLRLSLEGPQPAR